MKFDFCIGNPPYQGESTGAQKRFAPPVYHSFLEAAYNVADKVELIHPARFLFNAGSTPKEWNEKMLNDEHFKILHYEAKSENIFSNTSIRGGIAISYRDKNTTFGAIECFIEADQLRNVKNKVWEKSAASLSDIVFPAESYRFTETLHVENPNLESMLSKGHKYDLETPVMEKLNGIVFFDKIENEQAYAKIIGLVKGKRQTKFVALKYLRVPNNYKHHKVFLPKCAGAGVFGETLSPSIVAAPYVGHTRTFMSFGSFSTQSEAGNLSKYLKTKFLRALLGILKVTQDNPKNTWRYIPLQDFTFHSDIDWSGPIASIDQQLYKKYGLSQEEIDFIETHVKEME